MRYLLFFASLAAFGQTFVFNPFTNNLDIAGTGGGGGAVSSVTAGATGAIIVSPTTGAVIVDIDTAYVPSKTGTNAWTGSNVFTGGSRTAPLKSGLISALPATCTVGDGYFATDAQAGRNAYWCTAANTWTISGNVGGATALTTAGAVPYVTSAGVLGQDANFNWDSARAILKLGNYLQVLDGPNTPPTSGSGVNLVATGSSGTVLAYNHSGSAYIPLNLSGSRASFLVSGTEAGRFAPTTGNLLIGGTTDGNYRLDTQKSGSTGTARFYDQTAVSGSTLVVVQAGAGQSGNLLSVRNNAGTELIGFTSGGSLSLQNSGNYYWNTRSAIGSPSDGSITITNNAGTDFNRLQFGGTTSSFPALKRSSAGIQFRLADDSALTTVQASNYISNDGSTGVTGATCSSFKNGLCVAP